MKNYHAFYRTASGFAQCLFEATSLTAALKKARAIHDADPLSLDWHSYDGSTLLEEIEINGEFEGETILWQSAHTRLYDAAPELLAALETCVLALHANRSAVDPAIRKEAVRQARAAIAQARPESV